MVLMSMFLSETLLNIRYIKMFSTQLNRCKNLFKMKTSILYKKVFFTEIWEAVSSLCAYNFQMEAFSWNELESILLIVDYWLPKYGVGTL